MRSVVFFSLLSSALAVDTDCWNFVWPGPYNFDDLNVTATCEPSDVSATEETIIAGPSSGRMLFNKSTTQKNEFTVDPDPRFPHLPPKTIHLRAFGDDEFLAIDIGVPCKEPIVFTYNNTKPDIDAMMDLFAANELPSSSRCSRLGDQWCIKWTHIQDGYPIEVSRFCGRARQEKPAGTKITSGCYTQQFNRYEREICFCDNENLCNDAATLDKPLLLGLLLLSLSTVSSHLLLN